MRYDVPNELQPISPWKYFLWTIVYNIPLVGWIFLICHAIGSHNVNKRNHARSFFCVFVILAIVLLIVWLTGAAGDIATFFANLFAPK